MRTLSAIIGLLLGVIAIGAAQYLELYCENQQLRANESSLITQNEALKRQVRSLNLDLFYAKEYRDQLISDLREAHVKGYEDWDKWRSYKNRSAKLDTSRGSVLCF